MGQTGDKRRNVLVIEDNPSDAEMIKFVVEGMGYQVFHLTNPFDGLELLERQVFDLVLLDWQLPNLSGIDFLKRMRRTDELKKLPVILISGRNEAKHIKTALDTGAIDYVVKPVDPMILQAKIQRVIEKRVEWAQAPVTGDKNWEGAEAAQPIEVLSLSEVGVDLKGPYEENQVLEVRSPVLQAIGIAGLTVRIVGVQKTGNGGRVLQGSFVGLREGDLQKIRVYLKALAAKQNPLLTG